MSGLAGLLEDRLTEAQNRKLTDAARRWVVRLTSGNMTEREFRRFREWTADPEHDRVFRHEMAAWRKLGHLRSALDPDISLPSAAAVLWRRSMRWLRLGGSVTALTAMLVLAGPSLLVRAQADHLAGPRVETTLLADASPVKLDADAAIAVRYSAGERRIALLRGRAWFDVAHANLPFRVDAGDGVVEDVGTAFEVADVGGHFETAVSQGRIRLFADGGARAPLPLAAGQRARFGGGEPARLEPGIPANRVAAWRDGNIVLENVSVGRALAEVGRYRGAPTWIWGRLKQSRPITVVLRSDRPELALEALAASADLSLLRLPGGVMIVRQAPAR